MPDLDVEAARVRVITQDRAGNVAQDDSDGPLAIEASPPLPPPPPAAYALGPNVPNPFNPNTSIGVDLPASGPVHLQVMDLRGRSVVTLWAGWRDAGHHAVAWDGRDGEGRPLPSGVYVYRLQAGSYLASRKLTILR